MKLFETKIRGLKILEPKVFKDSRGIFLKTFNYDFFYENGLDINIKETYFTISHKNVIRGMHFQVPPHDHIKTVYVPNGKIIDVVLDIRKKSQTYGEYFSTEISSDNGIVLIIPKGLAHGFRALEDNTNVTYMQTTCYSPEHDKGIRYNSFGFSWSCDSPKLSKKDIEFPIFKKFDSPFVYGENS